MQDLGTDLVQRTRKGMVIPAHPLALDESRRLDERRQCALTRYYLDAGAGGIAVGVHTTQFEIRDPNVALLEPVLKLASRTIDEHSTRTGRPVLKVAGVCGKTEQARKEAGMALDNGYHAGLLSLSALSGEDVPALVRHCREIASIMPIIGFYLQPSVGGRLLPYEFWRAFADIDNVLAVKIAPFNRYQTLDVVRAIVEAGRQGEIALYTGNDDNIVIDLLTEYRVVTANGERRARIVGGLLGHWAVWTRRAVELLEEVHTVVAEEKAIPASLLTLAVQVTDANAALFDPANKFAGCIPGIHEVLRRQGLLEGTWCLNPSESLSPGQQDEIDRVYAAYPHLNDDHFVRQNLARWLA